jgi:CheY-like chemotaxis protein
MSFDFWCGPVYASRTQVWNGKCSHLKVTCMSPASQRVLIVDDDVMVADTLRMVLASYSANEGLSCAREFRPDLLLCDVQMPGRDGLSLVSDIVHELPECRILFLTGFYASLEAIKRYSRSIARPIGVLTKPCLPKDLLRQANAMLSTA